MGEFPDYEWKSSTLALVEDLVHSLDTGEPSRCGARGRAGQHRADFCSDRVASEGGARVELPLVGSTIRMERGIPAKQPRFERKD